MSIAFLQVAAVHEGVTVKDVATILGLISVGSGLIVGAYKLGAFGHRVEATEENAVNAVKDMRNDLGEIKAHIREEADRRTEWQGWRERHEERVDGIEKRVGRLEERP